jgi:hypothetical protein
MEENKYCLLTQSNTGEAQSYTEKNAYYFTKTL